VSELTCGALRKCAVGLIVNMPLYMRFIDCLISDASSQCRNEVVGFEWSRH